MTCKQHDSLQVMWHSQLYHHCCTCCCPVLSGLIMWYTQHLAPTMPAARPDYLHAELSCPICVCSALQLLKQLNHEVHCCKSQS